MAQTFWNVSFLNYSFHLKPLSAIGRGAVLSLETVDIPAQYPVNYCSYASQSLSLHIFTVFMLCRWSDGSTKESVDFWQSAFPNGGYYYQCGVTVRGKIYLRFTTKAACYYLDDNRPALASIDLLYTHFR